MYSCTRNLSFGGRLLIAAAATNAAAFCQTPEPAARPEFEVASIRLHANAGDKAYVQAFQGRLVMTNFSLKQLIVFAYDVPNNHGFQPLRPPGQSGGQLICETGGGSDATGTP